MRFKAGMASFSSLSPADIARAISRFSQSLRSRRADAPSRNAKQGTATESQDPVWRQGLPAASDADSIGIRISERVTIHVRVAQSWLRSAAIWANRVVQTSRTTGAGTLTRHSSTTAVKAASDVTSVSV